ncbi:hypothetical protein QWY99_08630 [Flavobacterium branchiarum]|uniref:Integrase catalytic domain-containing protein n=1 Tax=Flavobacterium branchiarum TaxID=1114870 RepID=A0ABV5FPW5_9FLAO|nr:hypothetical protein [Flavobacterium branchiarum]MDN3673111.1 hypothetical protein [Flavobacterium branchiarum]
MKSTPYEYYHNKLGIKISYLICDRSANSESLMAITYNALHRRMNSDTCIERQLRRASLNYDALILFSSLSQDWRDSLTVKFGSPKEEIKKSWFADQYEADRKAFDFFAAYTYGNDNKKLNLELIETYTYNASVLNTVIKLKANRKAYAKALGCTQIDIWETLTKDVNAFREVAHKLPTSSRGLRIQVSNYLKLGYNAIISGRLQNQNASKVKEDEQKAFIDELIAHHNNLDNAQISRLYNDVAKRLAWPTITPQTISNRKEEKHLTTITGRKGVKALSNTMLMQNKRKAPKQSMLYWTLDGLDVELLYQSTALDKKGYSTTTYHNRLTTVMVLDPMNKYIIGYAIGTHETPELIKAALRNAFQHTKELFGEMYRPYQLQSDNYQTKVLTPTYEACSSHYTPAKIGNAKSKVIEPFFNRFNKEYCQMFNNWSGYNVDSGSKNQPNDEYLNKIRHSFPDENGCRQQIISAIEADRAKKQELYLANFIGIAEEFKSVLNQEMYLRFLGQTTGFTNRLYPEGLTPTINGQTLCFDSFDINFRKLSHLDWAIKYDPDDLSKVLVLNADSKNGKLINEVGTYQFMLTEKYIQPMALAERQEGDALQLQGVKDYNNSVLEYITDEVHHRAELSESLFQRPELKDTLAKLLLVDSRGQHKDRRNDNRLAEKTKELIEVQTTVVKKEAKESWLIQQQEYNKSRININEYI